MLRLPLELRSRTPTLRHGSSNQRLGHLRFGVTCLVVLKGSHPLVWHMWLGLRMPLLQCGCLSSR